MQKTVPYSFSNWLAIGILNNYYFANNHGNAFKAAFDDIFIKYLERSVFMAYSLGHFRILIAKKLQFERFQHTIGVEVLACELAKRNGIDIEATALAALTHDLAKMFSQQEQLQKAKEWGLILYPEDLENLQVIHGRVAAYILENDYQITDQDILNAVANHTLGRPGMSPLEMLIYSADLTEPGRDFPGVDKLREKLYYDLKEGTLACVKHTMDYLKEKNKPIHPLTILTYQDLKKSDKE